MFRFFNADGAAGGTAAPAEGSTEQKPAAAVAVPESIINKIREDTLKAAREEASKIAAESGSKAAQEQAARVMRALGSDPEDDGDAKNEALIKKFFTDPIGTLAGVSQHATEQAERRIAARADQEAEQRRESAAASREVLKDRPDIYTNDSAKELLGTFYDGVDPKLPEKQKLEIALQKYDKHMESVGAPKVEDRVKAASVSSHASASGASSVPEKKPVKEAQAEAQRATQDEAVEAYKKKHGGRYPASWR